MATAPAMTRNLPSFEGLRPSTIRVSLVGLPLRPAGLTQRPVRGLVVRAATSIAPKVLHLVIQLPAFVDTVVAKILPLLRD